MQSQIPQFQPYPNGISAMSFQPSIQQSQNISPQMAMQTRKFQVEVPVEIPVPIEIPVQVPLYYDIHVNQTAYDYDEEEEDYLYEYLLRQSQALDRLLQIKYQQMAPAEPVQLLPPLQIIQQPPQVLPVQYVMQPPIYVEYPGPQQNQQPTRLSQTQPQPPRQVQKTQNVLNNIQQKQQQRQQHQIIQEERQQQRRIFETRQPSIIPKTHQQPNVKQNDRIQQLQNSSYLKK